MQIEQVPINIQICPDQKPAVEVTESRAFQNLQAQIDRLKAQVNMTRHTREVVIQTEDPRSSDNSPEHHQNFEIFQNSVIRVDQPAQGSSLREQSVIRFEFDQNAPSIQSGIEQIVDSSRNSTSQINLLPNFNDTSTDSLRSPSTQPLAPIPGSIPQSLNFEQAQMAPSEVLNLVPLTGSLSRAPHYRNSTQLEYETETQSAVNVPSSGMGVSSSSDNQIQQVILCPLEVQDAGGLDIQNVNSSEMRKEDSLQGLPRFRQQATASLVVENSKRLQQNMSVGASLTISNAINPVPSLKAPESAQMEQALDPIEAVVTQGTCKIKNKSRLETNQGFRVQRLNTMVNQNDLRYQAQSPIKAEIPEVVKVESKSSLTSSDMDSFTQLSDLEIAEPNAQAEAKQLFLQNMHKSQTFTNVLKTRVFHKTEQELYFSFWSSKYERFATKPWRPALPWNQPELDFEMDSRGGSRIAFRYENKAKKSYESDLKNLSDNLHLFYSHLLSTKSPVVEADLMTEKVQTCLRSATLSKRKYKFLPLFSKQRRLLQIHDLNMKQIKDQNLEKKQERNIRLLQSDQAQLTEAEKIKRSILFRVTEYVTKYISSVYISDRFFLEEKDQQLWAKLRFHHTCAKLRKREQRLQKEFEMLVVESEKSRFEKFFWRKRLESCNEPVFARIINRHSLELLTEPVLLNSLKTKAEVMGVLAYLEWNSVLVAANLFEERCSKITKQQTSRLEKQLARSMAIKQTRKEVSYLSLPRVLYQLSSLYKRGTRLPPLTCKYKLGYCKESIRDFVVDNVFISQRFTWVSALFDSEFLRVVNDENRRNLKCDKLKVPSLFKLYPEYGVVSSSWQSEVSSLVFNHSKQTIYKYLIVPENDVIVFSLISNLYRSGCKKYEFEPVEINGAYERLFGMQGNLEFPNPMRRQRTIKVLCPQALASHAQINRALLPPNQESNDPSLVSEYGDAFATSKAAFVGKLKRSNALDNYDTKMCEYAVFQILKEKEYKIRDHNLLLYKAPTKWVQTKDKVANLFHFVFCLKSQFVRHPETPQLIMEVFKASNMQETLKKINSKKEAKFSRTKSKLKFDPIKDREPKQSKTAMSKELRSVMPQDFLTDDSMKDIEFEDVKSGESLEADKDSQYGLIKKKLKMSLFNLTQVQTPLKYYQNLSSKNKFKRKAKSLRKQRIFEMVKASDLEKVEGGKKREQTLMDINLTFVDELMYIKNDKQEQQNKEAKQRVYFQRVVQRCLATQRFSKRKLSSKKNVVGSQTIQQSKVSSPMRMAKHKVVQKKFKEVMNKMTYMSPTSAHRQWDSDFEFRMKTYQQFKIINTMQRVRNFYPDNELNTGNEIEILNDLKVTKQARKKRTGLVKKGVHKWNRSRSHHSELNWRQLSQNQKLHWRMQSVTDRLNLKFLLEVPPPREIKPATIQEERPYSSDPTVQKKFESQIFAIFIAKNYQKIDDLLRRYFITAQNLQTERGDSLLALSVHMGDEKMVELLLNRGINPNTQNKHGDTPLHYAVSSGRMNLASLLIENGADEHIKNKRGLNAWQMLSLD